MAWGSVNVPGGSTQGANGKSAYELAVENGFSGTLEEWLASLKGDKGDDGEAGKDGAVGPAGQTGPAGPGLPAGGTVGQVPVKKAAADYDIQWKTLTPNDIFGETSTIQGSVVIQDTLRADAAGIGNGIAAEGNFAVGTSRSGGNGSIAFGYDCITANAIDVAVITAIDTITKTCTVTADVYFFKDLAENEKLYLGSTEKAKKLQ